MVRRWFGLAGSIALLATLAGPAVGQQRSMIDLNRATRDQLLAFDGIGQAYADKIIAARPFKMRSELVSRNIMPATQYLKIKGWLLPDAEDAAAEAAMNKPADLGPPKDDMGRVNLNTASVEDLRAVPGIGQGYADKIVAGRPYKSIDELVKRNIMPAAAFNRIMARVFVR